MCKLDAEKEAYQAPLLIELASENLNATIEALIYPTIKDKDYIIVWEN